MTETDIYDPQIRERFQQLAAAGQVDYYRTESGHPRWKVGIMFPDYAAKDFPPMTLTVEQPDEAAAAAEVTAWIHESRPLPDDGGEYGTVVSVERDELPAEQMDCYCIDGLHPAPANVTYPSGTRACYCPRCGFTFDVTVTVTA